MPFSSFSEVTDRYRLLIGPLFLPAFGIGHSPLSFEILSAIFQKVVELQLHNLVNFNDGLSYSLSFNLKDHS